jgi:hypothetical protein
MTQRITTVLLLIAAFVLLSGCTSTPSTDCGKVAAFAKGAAKARDQGIPPAGLDKFITVKHPPFSIKHVKKDVYKNELSPDSVYGIYLTECNEVGIETFNQLLVHDNQK